LSTGEHLSASIAIFGEKLATTTIMCVSITNRGSHASAVARLSSVLFSLNAARIFVQIVRNLHWGEERRQTKRIVILSETKNLFYIGVKNAGVHFTVAPGKTKVTLTVAGILSG
jgi:hypothetical protein